YDSFLSYKLLPAWKITRTICTTSRNKLSTNLTVKHNNFATNKRIDTKKDKILFKTAISVSSLIVSKFIELSELQIFFSIVLFIHFLTRRVLFESCRRKILQCFSYGFLHKISYLAGQFSKDRIPDHFYKRSILLLKITVHIFRPFLFLFLF